MAGKKMEAVEEETAPPLITTTTIIIFPINLAILPYSATHTQPASAATGEEDESRQLL